MLEHEQAQFSSNQSLIELQKFKFEHSEFQFLPFLEFKLEFGCEFSKLWPEYFEYFRFYRVPVCCKNKSLSLSLIKLQV